MADQWPFAKPLEFLQKVKYGGAVGKLTVLSVVALIVLAVALLSAWGNVEAVYVIVGVVFLVFGVAHFSIHKTLQKHPELALLDGTELVAYRKMEIEMAAKGFEVPTAPAIPSPDRPPVLELPEAQSAEEEQSQ